MTTEHSHPPGEELLALLLEWRAQGDAEAARAAGRSLQELRACAHCQAELEELERAVGGVRALLLQDEADLASDAFQQRVLATTTREDLGLIGDLRLVLRFCGTRLRASRALRLAAASLLAHMIALPVLAYFVLRSDKEPDVMHITIEGPQAEWDFAEEPQEPERDLVALDPPAPEVTPQGDPSDAFESSIRLAEGLLTQAEMPSELATNEGASALERLLAARAACIRREPSSTWRAGVREPADDAGMLEWCLWTELLLDDRVLSGRADPGLATALDAISALESHPLVVLALARAKAYGDLRHSQRDVLTRLRAELARAGTPDPLDRRWFEALRDAGGPQPAPGIQSWVDWGLSRDE